MPTSRRFLLAGLAASAASLSSPRLRAAETAPPLRLGALFPFSGGLALLGDESFRGLDLAVDECNAGGGLFGHPVALARGDAGDAATATTEAKRLIEKEKVAAIFGSFASDVSFAASAVAEVASVPYLEMDALADAITARGFKLLFRTGPLASACGVLAVDAVADLLAPLWHEDPRVLKTALLHEDGLAGTAVADAQDARCKERGIPVVERLGYGMAALDFAPLVQRLRGSAADVVLHTGLANDVVAFHRVLKQAGWRPRMVIGAGGGYALNDTAQALGPEFQGAMNAGSTPYHVSDVVAPGVAEVAAAYQRKFGAPPRSGHSLVSFTGARLCFDAIRRAGDLAPDKLRAALLATDVPSGSTVGGWGVKFDEHGQNTRATPFLGQWQHGDLVTIAPRMASVAGPVGVLGG